MAGLLLSAGPFSAFRTGTVAIDATIAGTTTPGSSGISEVFAVNATAMGPITAGAFLVVVAVESCQSTPACLSSKTRMLVTSTLVTEAAKVL